MALTRIIISHAWLACILLRLDRAQQRKLSCLGQVHRLIGLGFGYFIRIDAGDADTFLMDLKHDSYRIRVRSLENILQHKDDKLHRRKIVIVKKDLEKLRFFEPGFLLGQDLGVMFG